MIEIRPPAKKDSPREYMRFFNRLIEEDTFLLRDRKQTLKQEKRWFSEMLERVRKREGVTLSAFEGKRVVGNCIASIGIGKQRQNVLINISVSKGYRRKGLGEKLLRSIIRLAKQRLKPRVIHLSVIEGNRAALNLYHKVGFEEVAVMPRWIKHRGRYLDEIYLVLGKG